jgi:predicted P-loop ATPase
VDIPAPGDKPSGWDVADAIGEGLTGTDLEGWMTSRIRGFTRNLEPDTPPASLADAKKNDSWRDMLLYRRSECVSCLSNIHLILTHEDCWQGVIAYDEFSQRVMKRKAPPFVGGTSGEWEANDDACTAIWLTRLFSMTPSLSQVGQAVEVVARRNAFHPVREWLKSLHPHDGVPRLGDWLSDFVGVPKTEYTQLVGQYFLIGMVARVMDPGCKFDYCMVLEGAQGQGKSTLFSILAGEWFGDTDLDLYNKDSMSALRGKWLYEFAELDAIARAESSRHKSFLSRKIDEFRPAYASREVRFPRQTVFGGSVNQWEWNKDPTGGRRFWPIEVKQEIALEELSRAREKLFAEALAEYTAGARYWPTRWHQMEYFDPEQLKIERSESLVDALHDWVFTQYQEFSLADAVIHGLDLDASKLTRDMETRVGNALRKLGCERVEKRNGMTRFWYKPPQKSATTSASSEDANAAF